MNDHELIDLIRNRKIDINNLCQNEDLSDYVVEKAFRHLIKCQEFIKYQKLSEQSISLLCNKYPELIGRILINQNVPETVIKKHINVIRSSDLLTTVLATQNLSEEFLWSIRNLFKDSFSLKHFVAAHNKVSDEFFRAFNISEGAKVGNVLYEDIGKIKQDRKDILRYMDFDCQKNYIIAYKVVNYDRFPFDSIREKYEEGNIISKKACYGHLEESQRFSDIGICVENKKQANLRAGMHKGFAIKCRVRYSNIVRKGNESIYCDKVEVME